MRAFRPHEASSAIAYYTDGFQTPRRTLSEIEAIIIEAGFRIVDWHEHRQGFLDHYALVTPQLLADCRRHNPSVSVRDLMSRYYTMVLVKC